MLIQLKNVKKYFYGSKDLLGRRGSVVRAVDNVDLSLAEGEHLGLVGESGSGKTTLGRLILKLYASDGGTILFDGKEITRLSARAMRPLRKEMQMVFQDPYSSLDPRYTVRGILQEAFLPEIFSGKRLTMREQQKRMEDILAAVGLPKNCLMRFPHEFSGGERQRIAIARALLMDPRLLILDEAVSSLDVLIQEEILKLLKNLEKAHNVTYLFITHNLRVVKKICRKVAVMYQGKIIETGSVEQIFENPLHPYTQELLAAALDYKAIPEPYLRPIDVNSHLIDKGKGHFVINYK
jgi:oligopeptide transport system ATP-binding protein